LGMPMSSGVVIDGSKFLVVFSVELSSVLGAFVGVSR
jgi:hypothetical protein